MKVAVRECFWEEGRPLAKWQEAFGQQNLPVGAFSLKLELYKPFRRYVKIARILANGKDVVEPLLKAEVFDAGDGLLLVEGVSHDEVVNKYHAQSWRLQVLGP
jgi:hypothetical protein